MTMPTSGPVLFSAIRAEIGVSGPIGLGDGNVRSLAGVLSGPISAAACYGRTGSGGGGSAGGGVVGGGDGGDAGPIVIVGGGGLSVSATGAADQGEPTGTQFTSTIQPLVAASGGSGGYAYLWTITTQADASFVLSSATAAQCAVKHVIGKFGYVGSCTLSCTVTDTAGNTVTVTGIPGSFDYRSTV